MTCIRNPFRDRTMRMAFDDCVRMHGSRHRNLFTPDGRQYRGNSIASMFWRGYENVTLGEWDAESKRMMAYAHWRAGRAIAEEESRQSR